MEIYLVHCALVDGAQNGEGSEVVEVREIGLEERSHDVVAASREGHRRDALHIVIGNDPLPNASDQFGAIVHQFFVVAGVTLLEKKKSALSDKVGCTNLWQNGRRSEDASR